MNFVKIFISAIAFLLACCGNKTVDKAQTAHYVYVNNFTSPVTMSLNKRGSGNLRQEHIINPKDSIVFTEIELGVAGPFAKSQADSVVFKFSYNKCVSYVRDGGKLPNIGKGVFNLENYRDFTIEMLKQREYRIAYVIGDSDYNQSVICP